MESEDQRRCFVSSHSFLLMRLSLRPAFATCAGHGAYLDEVSPQCQSRFTWSLACLPAAFLMTVVNGSMLCWCCSLLQKRPHHHPDDGCISAPSVPKPRSRVDVDDLRAAQPSTADRTSLRDPCSSFFLPSCVKYTRIEQASDATYPPMRHSTAPDRRCCKRSCPLRYLEHLLGPPMCSHVLTIRPLPQRSSSSAALSQW